MPPTELARSSTRARSADLDALRVIGIAAVVVGHVWDGGVVAQTLYPWHVPLFFFLTGYLWTPGRTMRTEVGKRWPTLGIPYLTWLAVIYVGWVIAAAVNDVLSAVVLARPLWGGMFAARPFSAFWFVSALFFVAILYRFLERFPAWVAWTVGAIGLVACYVAGEWIAMIPLSAGVAVPCLLFVLAGRALRVYRSHIPHVLALALFGLVASAALVASGWSSVLNIKYGNLGTPVLGVLVATLICGSLVVVAERFVPLLGVASQRVIFNLAAGGLFVVLSHAAVLQLLETPRFGAWHDLLLALVLPWVLATVALYTPAAPYLCGVARRARISLPARVKQA